MENVIIIGSGPAAYTAALYTLKHNPLLFEGEIIGGIGPGGQLTTTTAVDNYPGFPKGVQGPELMDAMKNQATSRGLRVVSRSVSKVKKENGRFIVQADNDSWETKCVIIATGASAKRLDAPGTKDGEYWQKGISACAICDGFFFKDDVVGIIGGGDAAMEEAHYMSKLASKVYLIHRRDEFRARSDMLKRVKSQKNVEIVTPATLVSAHGSDFLEYIKLKNERTGEIFNLKMGGLFFAIGHVPNTSFLEKDVKLTDLGYIDANECGHTSVEGLFACGDVQDHKYRQAVTAAASGCIAGIESCKYIERDSSDSSNK